MDESVCPAATRVILERSPGTPGDRASSAYLLVQLRQGPGRVVESLPRGLSCSRVQVLGVDNQALERTKTGAFSQLAGAQGPDAPRARSPTSACVAATQPGLQGDSGELTKIPGPGYHQGEGRVGWRCVGKAVVAEKLLGRGNISKRLYPRSHSSASVSVHGSAQVLMDTGSLAEGAHQVYLCRSPSSRWVQGSPATWRGQTQRKAKVEQGKLC